MSFSRQALLGTGMIIGGSVMLYAMVQQIGISNDPTPVPALVEKSAIEQPSTAPLTTDIDTEKRLLAQKRKERAIRAAEQEKRAKLFLVEQEKAEAQALAKSRAENEQYIANTRTTGGDKDSPEAAQNKIATPSVQQRPATTTNKTAPSPAKNANADADNNKQQQAAALKKAQAEAKKLEDKKQADKKEKAAAEKQAKAESKKKEDADAKKKTEAKKQTEEKAAAEQKKKAEKKEAETAKKSAPNSPTDYTVKSGDALLKLARQHNVSVAALAQANDITPSSTLQIGQALTIPSRKQIQRLEREAATAEKARVEKRKAEEAQAKKSADAQQKLSDARKEVKETDAKGSFGVQVALATNQASADEVAKKYKAAGYKVKTSATSRGVRVVVGPERGKVAALALKDKVNSDPDVDTTSAWVLYWR